MLRIFYSFTVCNFEKRVESVARFNQYKLWIKSHMFKPKSLFTSMSRRVISQNERKLNLKLILFNVNSLQFIVTSVFWFVIFFKKHLPQKVCIFATILAGSVKNFGEVSSATNSSDHFSPKSRHFKWNIFFFSQVHLGSNYRIICLIQFFVCVCGFVWHWLTCFWTGAQNLGRGSSLRIFQREQILQDLLTKRIAFLP